MRYTGAFRGTSTAVVASIPMPLLRVCLVSLVLVWCPVRCQESLTNRMRAISEDLDRQLNEIMASQALSYSTINTARLPYNATTKFNPKGMGQLYNVTNMFIDLVQSKQAYPTGERSPTEFNRDFAESREEKKKKTTCIKVTARRRRRSPPCAKRSVKFLRPASMVTPYGAAVYALREKWPVVCW